MDNIDEKILQELAEDARKPFRIIAKKLGVSTQTIIRKYNEMKRNGSIIRSTITLNLEKLGYEGTAHLLIRTKLGVSSTQLIEQLSKTPNIIIATRAIGAYDVYAVLAFRDMKELYNDVSKLNGLPDLLTTDLSFGMPGILQFFPAKMSSGIIENRS